MKNDDLSAKDEKHIASMLRAAGQREDVPEDLKRNWLNHFRHELEQVIEHRRQKKRRWLLGCASVAIFAMVFVFRLQPVAVTEKHSVVQVSGNSLLITAANTRPLVAGQLLSPESTLQTGDASFLSINYRGFDVRLNTSTRLRLERDRLVLLEGEIYARSTGDASTGGLVVETPFAAIRDIGTQFTVTLGKDTVITTVREGRVLVVAGDTRTEATASDSGSQQVTVNSRQELDVTLAASTGNHWEWIYAVSPPFQLEGQTAYAFLRWSVQESGLDLKFADQHTEMYARATILHGDISGLSPQAAVSPVLATTHLVATKAHDNTLLIQLQR